MRAYRRDVLDEGVMPVKPRRVSGGTMFCAIFSGIAVVFLVRTGEGGGGGRGGGWKCRPSRIRPSFARTDAQTASSRIPQRYLP
jgi:hypothetical protein